MHTCIFSTAEIIIHFELACKMCECVYKLQYFQTKNHDRKLYTLLGLYTWNLFIYSIYIIYGWYTYETRYYAKIFKLINHAREPCSLITSRHHYYHRNITFREYSIFKSFLHLDVGIYI